VLETVRAKAELFREESLERFSWPMEQDLVRLAAARGSAMGGSVPCMQKTKPFQGF
jgi:hypothetical protein